MSTDAKLYPFDPAGAGRITIERVIFAVDGQRCECAVFVGEHIPRGWFAVRRGWEPWRIFSARALFGPTSSIRLEVVAQKVEACGADFFRLPLAS